MDLASELQMWDVIYGDGVAEDSDDEDSYFARERGEGGGRGVWQQDYYCERVKGEGNATFEYDMEGEYDNDIDSNDEDWHGNRYPDEEEIEEHDTIGWRGSDDDEEEEEEEEEEDNMLRLWR